jgi:hypothetical protein
MTAEEQQKIRAEAAQSRQIVNQLTAGGSALAGGMIPVEEAQLLLDHATKLIMGEGAGATAPPPTESAAQTFDDNAIYAEALKFAPSQWRSKLQREVQLGKITQEQASRVLLLLERGKR